MAMQYLALFTVPTGTTQVTPVGTSVIPGYKGWFDLTAFAFGASNPFTTGTGGGGGGAGKAQYGPVLLTLPLPLHLATFFRALSVGSHFQTVRIVGISDAGGGGKGGYNVFEDYTFGTAFSSYINYGTSSGSDSGFVEMQLNYVQIAVQVNYVDAKGVLQNGPLFQWDIARNAPPR